jgi:hypothetical protein
LKLIDGTSKELPDLSKIPLDPDIMEEALPDPQTPREAPVPRLPN